MTHAEEKEDLATEQAALWILALEERPDDSSLHARFQDWLDEDPSHAAAWADASRIYGMVTLMPPAHREHWAPYRASRQGAGTGSDTRRDRALGARAAGIRAGGGAAGRRRPGWRRLVLGAGAAALAAGFAFVLMPGLLLQVRADYRTATAGMRSLQLEDGSTVRLAPDSAISVALEGRVRRVQLLRGEAFFDVMPDPSRPFHVVAGSLTTTVVGTEFNVRLGDDLAGVAVREGQVAVRHGTDDPEESLILTAGDWVRIDHDEKVVRGRIPPEDVGSWIEGRTIARDRAMADVLDDLRRNYAGLIILTDETLGARRVTGVYDLEDPVASVRLLTAALGAVVRRISPWIILVSPG